MLAVLTVTAVAATSVVSSATDHVLIARAQ
jgi:hypothetical protein